MVHREWSAVEYTTLDDLKRDKNMTKQLKLNDIGEDDLTEMIKDASSRLERKVGIQSSSDRTVNELCRLYVYLRIAKGLPIAEQTGEQERVSHMGLVPGIEREIRELVIELLPMHDSVLM